MRGIPIRVVKQHAKVNVEARVPSGIVSKGTSTLLLDPPLVLWVPRSKAEVVCRNAGETVLFVDDDISELVQPDIAAAEHVFRVHFSRGS